MHFNMFCTFIAKTALVREQVYGGPEGCRTDSDCSWNTEMAMVDGGGFDLILVKGSVPIVYAY